MDAGTEGADFAVGDIPVQDGSDRLEMLRGKINVKRFQGRQQASGIAGELMRGV